MNLQQIFLKSKQLMLQKQNNPEENPEEFQALQKAYKIAAQYAKRNKTVSSRKQPETPGNMLPLWDFKANAPISQVQSPDEQSLQEQVLKKAVEQREAKETCQEPETVFDFSEIDTYGDKERFFRQFYLIAKNPCIKNKRNVWDVFLNQPSFGRLFLNDGFRANFVRALCGLSGWQRETILFFDNYLKQFHGDGKVPKGGKWETDFPCFRWQKRFRIRVNNRKILNGCPLWKRMCMHQEREPKFSVGLWQCSIKRIEYWTLEIKGM